MVNAKFLGQLDESEDDSNKTVLESIVKDGFTPTMENILKEEERYIVFLSELSKLRSKLDPHVPGQNNNTISEDDFNKIFLKTKELHDIHRQSQNITIFNFTFKSNRI